MNVVYALGAYPAGVLADRTSAHRLLGWGLGCLIAADAALAWGHGLVVTFAGIGLWGAHMALTQGLLAKLVADRSPAALRGTAFGFFNLITGMAMLLASVMAGILWDAAGPDATFGAGGLLALLALVASAALMRAKATPDQPSA